MIAFRNNPSKDRSGAEMNVTKRKLLLADDSVTIQKVVNLTFAEEGVDVTTVSDGDAALEFLSRERPDLVMADVNMPGASGYQICEAIRAHESTRTIPVVLLVGSFEPFDESEAERVGANAFMTKPFQSIRQLVTNITEMMAASADQPDPVGDAILDDDKFDGDSEIEQGDDIDRLYEQSLVSAGANSGEMVKEFDFGDSGLDDEMIETSYASRDNDLETIDFGLADVLETDQPDVPSEQQFDPSPFYPEGDPAAETVELPRSVAETYQDENYRPPEVSLPTAWEEPLPNPEPEPLAFERITDEPEEPSPQASYQAPAFDIPEVSDTREVPQNEPADLENHVDELYVSEGPGMHQEPMLPTQSEPSFVSQPTFEDIDLLELPPVGEDRTIEFTTPELAIEETGSKQVVALSPELMELLVQKVVEKLAQKY